MCAEPILFDVLVENYPWKFIREVLNYYRPQRSWGKVIFSEACVNNSFHSGGRPWLHGHAWLNWGGWGCAWLHWGNMCGCTRGHAWLHQGGMCGCTRGGMHSCTGGHVLLHWGVCMVAPGGMCGCTGRACMVAPGGCVWLHQGGMRGYTRGMCGCTGGCAWLHWGGHAWLHWGGHVWLHQGGCMVALGGHVWLHGGHVWFYLGGVHGFIQGACKVLFWGVHGFIRGVHGFFRYNEIWSMSRRYASYWNAFLLALRTALELQKGFRNCAKFYPIRIFTNSNAY